MARRRPNVPTARTNDAQAAIPTRDSIVNLAARLGLGADNLSSQSSYAYSIVSRNRQNIDNAYRGSWLVGVAVDSVADDMTRAGLEMMGDITPKDIEAIQGEFNDKGLWHSIGNTARWARLYGGAIAVILIDGQNPTTPLRTETIRKDQFKGLLVLDRWMVTPSLEDVITEFGPEMGQPMYYTVNSTMSQGGSYGYSSNAGIGQRSARSATDLAAVRIHYTRVIRLDGNELPFFARQAEQGWGQSILERLYDRLLAYDSATQGAAQLVFKAHLRTLQVDGLREAIAFGGKALEGLASSVDFIRKFQTSDGLTLLDAKDVFSVHSYSFAGLPELLSQFSEQLSGALQIPLVRLFGQSPSGFSTGDADLQNYYDMIGSQQESKLRRPVHRLLDVVSRSKLGKPLPDGFGFKFTSLWQMKAAEKATVAGTIVTAVVAAEAAGIVSQKVAMEELRQSSHQTGIFTNISDEDIEAAESDPPSMTESLPGVDPNADPNVDTNADPAAGPGAAPAPPSFPGALPGVPTGDADFEERAHPRDGGKFSHTAGAGAAAKVAKPARAALSPAAGTGKDRTHANGTALPPHIAALKLPPAWTDVHYSADPNASLLAQGKDSKGRLQSVYSAEFSATQAKAKFGRVKALAIQFPAIQAQNAVAQRSANPKVRDAADCLDLIMQTGIRPGSDDDTGAAKKAYGATTLKGEHVVTDDNGTSLKFVGKKGVSLDIKIEDPKLAAALQDRAKKAGPDGSLFPNVTDKSLLDHTHTMGDGSFKTKDLRTHLGTKTAAELVRSMPVPTDAKSHKAAVMAVAKQVAAKLGNSAAIALQSYIAPETWASWGAAHAA